MLYVATTAVNKILSLKKRLKIIQGGSSAGKTIAILLILIDRAQTEEGKVFSVVSETLPHLKRGAIRDFLNIMEGHGYFKEASWNRTDFIYTFETGTKIEFFSADNAEKVRGPRRDVLFINEANNVTYETYTQLAIRTNGDIYVDYNPVAEFWAVDLSKAIDPEGVRLHDFIILTYKDNEGLPQTIVDELESRRERKGWFQVYGLGELGEVDGKIYKDWQIIEEIPHTARLERYGLDYGYSNDPTAIIAIYYSNGGYILDEIAFQKGLSNKQIADILLNHEQAMVVPDSAEPKSNDELKSYGLVVVPAEKGKDSVLNGIQLVQDQKISVTQRSYNVIKEYKNYLWKIDKDGKIINEPEHTYSHSMDAIRYGMTTLIKKPVFTMEASAPLLPYYGDDDLSF